MDTAHRFRPTRFGPRPQPPRDAATTQVSGVHVRSPQSAQQLSAEAEQLRALGTRSAASRLVYSFARDTRAPPRARDVADFPVASEQYYMHVNPNNHVLAETTFSGEHLPWLEGHHSPVAWVRNWGEGRVFFHSIGHSTGDLEEPNVRRLTKQGLQWAVRK